MNINGKNGLACITNLKELKEPVELRPLPGLPVIRDLIVDMSQFFKQYHSIKPYLVNDTPPPEKERLQSPDDREELDGLYECILCACCSTVVPVVLVEPRQVRRSRGLLQAYRFIADSARPRDQRASRQPRRSVPAVPLPHDHELRRRLSRRVSTRRARSARSSDLWSSARSDDDGQSRARSGIAARRSPTTRRAGAPPLALPARHAGERPDARALPRRARRRADRSATSQRSTGCSICADNDLWDLLSGRIEPADAALQPLVRAACAAMTTRRIAIRRATPAAAVATTRGRRCPTAPPR